MTEQITLEIQAEASGQVRARRTEIWQALADPAHRPNLKSCQPLAGVWPEECARIRTVMDKGSFEMIRTETVIRCVPEERLVIKVEAPAWGSTAWLDHRIEPAGDGWRLTIAVIATASFPDGAGPVSRGDYAKMTEEALQVAVLEYRKRIEGKTT
jgi:uncharacterized protein YndB with AHSA1/START domain